MNNEQTKTPGQIAYEAHHEQFNPNDLGWEDVHSSCWKHWEKIASAVISHVLQGAKWVMLGPNEIHQKGDEYFGHSRRWLELSESAIGSLVGDRDACRRLISLSSSVRPEMTSEEAEEMRRNLEANLPDAFEKPVSTPPASSGAAGADVPRFEEGGKEWEAGRVLAQWLDLHPEFERIVLGKTIDMFSANAAANFSITSELSSPSAVADARPRCKSCHCYMTPSKAIPDAVVNMGDGQYSKGSWVVRVPVVDVWKCPECGHSFQCDEPAEPVVEEKPALTQYWQDTAEANLKEAGRERARAEKAESERDQLRKELERWSRSIRNVILQGDKTPMDNETLRDRAYKAIDARIAEFTSENAALKEELAREQANFGHDNMTAALHALENAGMGREGKANTLRAMAEEAASELTRLRSQFRWTPISERLPTEKDADENGQVWTDDPQLGIYLNVHYTQVAKLGKRRWMTPIPFSPPSPENEEQEMRRQYSAACTEYGLSESKEGLGLWMKIHGSPAKQSTGGAA